MPTDRMLNEREAAALIGLSPRTLRQYRWLGGDLGPRWRKINRSVRYPRSEVDRFIAAAPLRSSTR